MNEANKVVMLRKSSVVTTENQQFLNILKKFTFIYYILRFIYRLNKKLLLFSKQSWRYMNHLFNDSYPPVNPYIYQKRIKENVYWYDEIKKTQLRKRLPLFLDRQLEVSEFFKISPLYLMCYFYRNSLPHTKKYKNRLMSVFEGNTESDNALTKAYDKSSFGYAVRLMLAYERYSFIIPFMDFIFDNLRPIENIKVLDYGCGVSDIGILFASSGARVTIADLDNKKLEFTIWRYRRRQLNSNVVKIKSCQDYPTFTKSEFDLIIATEIFEHVRAPLLLLKNLSHALRKGGFLLDTSDGKIEEKDIGAEHLQEAINTGYSREYKECYKNNYRRIFKCLFKKIHKFET